MVISTTLQDNYIKYPCFLVSEKKELLRNEVLKITAGRIGSILSITSKQKKLQELQTEQVQAVETEDYEKGEFVTKCFQN